MLPTLVAGEDTVAELPSARLRALIAGPSPWYEVEWHEVVTSTNDVARQRAVEGAGPGLVVVADRQTAGRGRQGRRWVDHPGGSLLTSLLVPVPQEHPTLLPLAVGVAVRYAIRRAGAAAELKWPNDVLIRGRKCAGILIEDTGGGTAVAGIGVDTDWREVRRAGELEAWTSIAEETGQPCDRWELLTDLLASLE